VGFHKRDLRLQENFTIGATISTPFRAFILFIFFVSLERMIIIHTGTSQVIRTPVRLFVLGDTPDLVVGCPQILGLLVHNLSTGAIVIHRVRR